MDKPDTNRTTAFAYNADGKLLTLTARNSVTGDQVTRFVYGTTLEDSGVASNELLRAKIYPDSDDGDDLTDGNDGVYDRVEYKYNRLGEMVEAKDQAGTIHAYDYDKLGRLAHDRVTSLGAGVDDAVFRISREYEVRGMLSKVTSYDNATVGQGNVVNEVAMTYNSFGQLISDAQAHSGEVDEENTPAVAYEYADGSANTVRPAWIKYPNGRQLDYDYSGADDELSRISGINEHTDDVTLAGYTRLGLDQVVKLSYSEPAVDMTFIKLSGEPDGDAGDQYTGLDRFGRVEDVRWIKAGNNLEHVQHGYDRAGNKRWRKNLVAASGQDEFYNYDGLYQLIELQRGDLNNNRTAVAGVPAKQEDFTYDPTGNWQNYLVNVAGQQALNQDRTHNKANETWLIDGANATVGLDPVGNMARMPKVGDWSTAQQLMWDAWNRLVKIEEGSLMVATYEYDGLFRRTIKMASSQTQHFYYSSQWRVLETRVGSSVSANRQFIWGLLGIDDLILRDRFTSGSERLYAIHDSMHVTAIVDAGGDVQERYGYDAFGNTRVMDGSFGDISASAYDWETRFCGYRWDGESGLYQVRYRYLHSGLGRWLSRDPIGFKAKDVNLYRYVGNNSLIRIDPDGLRKRDCKVLIYAGHAYQTSDKEGKHPIPGKGLIGEGYKHGRHNTLCGDKFGYVGCGANDLNDRAEDSGIGIPGMPINRFPWPWNRGSELGEDQLEMKNFASYLKAAIDAAEKDAENTCGNSSSCCDNVNIRVECLDRHALQYGGDLCKYDNTVYCDFAD